jgi:hypothetical protein
VFGGALNRISEEVDIVAIRFNYKFGGYSGSQHPDRIRRVGVLMGLAEDDPDSKARRYGDRRSVNWLPGIAGARPDQRRSMP